MLRHLVDRHVRQVVQHYRFAMITWQLAQRGYHHHVIGVEFGLVFLALALQESARGAQPPPA